MNMDLMLIILIIYIVKNNNSQCYYVPNRNLRLLLLLVCIHKMDHCLNTNYRYMNSINNKSKYHLNYPNEVSNNSNTVTNSRKNINNDNKDSIINSNKDDIIDNKKNISNNKNSNADTLENILIKPTTKINSESSTYKYPCEKDDNLINNYNNSTINNNNSNKNVNLSNNKISNPANNFIKATTKIHTKSSTYKDSCEKDDNLINNCNNSTINNNANKNVNLKNIKISNPANSLIKSTTKNYTESSTYKDSYKKNNNISDNSNNIINSCKNSTINNNNNKDSKDSIINVDKEIIINDKNVNLNNNKISNPANNLIKPTTKNHTESSTYKDSCEKNHTMPPISINNTFTHLTLTKVSTSINQLQKHFNINNPLSLTNLKAKLPVLVGSTNITEVFHGNVNFGKPIISILKVTNEIFITNKSVLPTIHTSSNNAILYYEGFLKTQLEYLEDVSIEDYQIKCDSKHYIMLIPFCGSKELNFSDEIIKSSDIVIKDFTLDVNKSTFSVDTCLEEPVKINQYINLYKMCNLTVKAECNISLYRKNIVTL